MTTTRRVFRFATFAAASYIAAASYGGTNYVDCSMSDYQGHDGSSWAMAFETIQEGVDAALEGDVILVAPGRYDKGGRVYGGGLLDRVYVDRRLTIVAADPDPAATVIAGRKDPDHADEFGVGPNAVRCVRLAPDESVRGTVLKGFTLADGASHGKETSESASNQCGGFAGPMNVSAPYDTYIVDCIVTNCVGAYGGSIRRATAVRCEIVAGETLYGSAAGRNVNFFHCLVRRTSCAVNAITEANLVNCSVVENYGSAGPVSRNNTTLRNCILQLNETTYAQHETTSSATLFDAAQPTWLADDGTSTTAEQYPFVAPLHGDYRIRSGSLAETTGKAANIAAAATAAGLSGIPGLVEIYKSLDGVVVDSGSSSPICAGPYQRSVTVATGALVFRAPMVADSGYVGKTKNLYAHSTATPAVLQAKAISTDGRPICRYNRAVAHGDEYFPDLNEVVTLGYPPKGIVVTNTPVFASKVWYVNPDPAIGKDDVSEAGRGLSADKPFETIQYAVDQYAAPFEVIVCAAGTYAKGGSLYGGLAAGSNRVTIVAKYLRIKGAGMGKSIIQGEKDSDDPRGDGSQCGPKAMRCVYLRAEAAVQGFTLTGGRSGYDSGNTTGDIDANRGGLGYGYYERSSFLDCEFTDGRAYRGGFLQGTCKAIRCLFHDGTALSGGLVATGPRLFSCVVYDNVSGGYTLDTGTSLYHVTGVANASTHNYIISTNGKLSPTNCVLVGETSLNNVTLGYPAGTLMRLFGTITSQNGASIETANPRFVDAARHDYRVGIFSPAVTCSILPAGWWKLPAADYNGNPLCFIDGKPVAGAFQDVLSAVVVSQPAFGATVSNVGTNYIAAGESLTVVASDPVPAARPLKGCRVNGEDRLGLPASYTFTASAGGVPAAMTFEPLYISDWFVDPMKDDDSGDGFTPGTAKKTLTAAMSLPLLAGDTVHAAAGVYSNNSAKASWTKSNDVQSRVCVPAGVSLVSDVGAGETFIVGGESIRCVTLQAGAEISGFTLCGANRRDAFVSGSDADNGGGVFSPKSDAEENYAYIRNCVISNNVWCVGGGAYGGVLVNCRVYENYGWRTSGAFYGMIAYGCHVDGNICGSNELCSYPYGVYSCTIGSGNRNANSQGPTDVENTRNFCNIPAGCVFRNCLVLGKLYSSDVKGKFNAANCVFVTGKAATSDVTDVDGTCRWIDSVAAARMSGGWAPAKDSPVVDKGSLAYLPEWLDVDVAGGQRVYNGKVDVGAAEYDWRGDFAKDLSPSRVSVVAASPETEEADGAGVLMRNGELSATVTGYAPRRCGYSVPVVVNGTGTLAILLNGEEMATLTSTDGPTVLSFKNALPENALRFSYVAGAGDVGGALVGAIGIVPPQGMVLSFR